MVTFCPFHHSFIWAINHLDWVHSLSCNNNKPTFFSPTEVSKASFSTELIFQGIGLLLFSLTKFVGLYNSLSPNVWRALMLRPSGDYRVPQPTTLPNIGNNKPISLTDTRPYFFTCMDLKAFPVSTTIFMLLKTTPNWLIEQLPTVIQKIKLKNQIEQMPTVNVKIKVKNQISFQCMALQFVFMQS